MCIRDRSGTEPLIRVMVEANDLGLVERFSNRIADVVREQVGQTAA